MSQSAAKTNPIRRVKSISPTAIAKGRFAQTLMSTNRSAEGQKDDAYLALTGDIYSHHVRLTKARNCQGRHRPHPPTLNIYLSSVSCSSAPAIPDAERSHASMERRPGSGKILLGTRGSSQPLQRRFSAGRRSHSPCRRFIPNGPELFHPRRLLL